MRVANDNAGAAPTDLVPGRPLMRPHDGMGRKAANDRGTAKEPEMAGRLVQLRQRLGYTPAEMAAALNLSTRSYLPYERNQRKQRGWMRMTYRIVDAMDAGALPDNLSLNWLIMGRLRPWGPPADRPLQLDGRPLPPPMRVVGSE